MGARSIERVHFIEYNAKVNTLETGAAIPKYGTPLLAAILKERGYDARIFLEGVSDMDPGRLAACDVACFPVYAPILNKVRECARRLRFERPELPIIAGGPQVCLFPDTVLDACDYAVRCEGDEVLPQLIECLRRGGDPATVGGLSFRRNGEVVHTPDPPPPAVPATIPDPSLIDGFDRVPRGPLGRRLLINLLQTSRGCRFRCSFCPTAKLFGGTYRNRDVESVIADIRARVRDNPVFLVVDNSFLSNRERTRELLRRLVQESLGAHLIVFERHEIGKDDELLELMARAGVRCIIVGIESLSDENLDLYNKRQSSADVVASVHNILRHGIHVLGTFVLGGDDDTPARGRQILDFVRATGISLNLFIVHDLETNPERGLLIPLHRRFDTYYRRAHPGDTRYWDYLTGNFVTYFPRRMKPSTLQRCMGDIYHGAFSHWEIARRVASANLFSATFGVAHGYTLKRMSDTLDAVVDGGYMDYLCRIEEGLYDENEVLVEERLASLEGLPLPPPLEEQVNRDRYKGLTALGLLPGLARYALLRRRRGGGWVSG